jgi:outer membrane protein TolC
LFDAALAYFDWVKAYRESLIYSNFLENAEIRYKAVSRAAQLGAEAPIDTVEAFIPVQNRTLSLEQAGINLREATLGISNYLWMEDQVPVELKEGVVPDLDLSGDIDLTLSIEDRPLSEIPLEEHPKLRSMRFKVEQLEVDKKFKASRLLPVINLEYNFLSETPDVANSFQAANYKGGIEFAFPLFLRKERGDLKLAKVKLQDANLDLLNEQFRLRNKIAAVYTALESYRVQRTLISDIVVNYQRMLSAEERKFGLGDSSLFLINSRETKLIEAKLKEIELENKLYQTKAKLFNTMALPGQNI